MVASSRSLKNSKLLSLHNELPLCRLLPQAILNSCPAWPCSSVPWPLGERCSCSILVLNPVNNSRKFMEVSPGKLQSRLQDFSLSSRGLTKCWILDCLSLYLRSDPFHTELQNSWNTGLKYSKEYWASENNVWPQATDVDYFRVNLPVYLYFCFVRCWVASILLPSILPLDFLGKQRGACDAELFCESSVCEPCLC